MEYIIYSSLSAIIQNAGIKPTPLIKRCINYAVSTITSSVANLDTLLSYSLYIFTMRYINEVCRAHKQFFTTLDLEFICEIVISEGLTRRESSNPSLRVTEAIESLRLLYIEYINRIDKYRSGIEQEWIYNRIVESSTEYIMSLLSDKDNVTLKEYAGWKISNSGIRPVIHQLALYNGVSITEKTLLVAIPLIAGYQNDILSFNTDYKDGKSNLIDCIKKNYLMDYYGAYRTAIKLNNNIINVAYQKLMFVDDKIKEICEKVLTGTHKWLFTDPHYTKGRNILEMILNDDLDNMSLTSILENVK